MVGVALTPNPHKLNSANGLGAISNGRRFTRILLDLFAVSINPKKPKNGWNLVTKKTEETQKIEWKPKGTLEVLLPDDFIKYFMKCFSDLIEFEEDFEEFVSAGRGYNSGRKYKMKVEGSKGAIQFEYFDPEKSEHDDSYYASGSVNDNYVRQKVAMKLTGDGLQVLRAKGVLVPFLLRLYLNFECNVTMFDIALDMFNYKVEPQDFARLYRQNKYLGKSTVNGMDDLKRPTVYIGKYKGARTIMLYDKLLENKETGKSDEPEILEALEKSNGSWLRVEQHYERSQKEAKQAFDFLMIDVIRAKDSIDEVFSKTMSKFMRQQVENKCRFLSQKRQERNNSRIKTHKKWETILNAISETKSDFAFERKEPTLEERMHNFKVNGIGGGSALRNDILAEKGSLGLKTFFLEVAEYAYEQFKKEHETEEDREIAEMLDIRKEKAKRKKASKSIIDDSVDVVKLSFELYDKPENEGKTEEQMKRIINDEYEKRTKEIERKKEELKEVNGLPF